MLSLKTLGIIAREIHLQRKYAQLYKTNSLLGATVVKNSSISFRKISADSKREVEHHAKLADDWWKTNGPMSALHALNEIRVPFIRDGLISRGSIDSRVIKTTCVLQNQEVLEVGCGGGILTEQLARLAANVTAIDLGKAVIDAAIEHLNCHSPELKNRIQYKVESIEAHSKENPQKYDAVVVSEVIEHVDDKIKFLTACVEVLKPGGSLFITTPNKTLPMWFGGIVLGENVFNLAPPGTHHWEKLISPLDLQRILDALNCQTILVNGSTYEFWKNTWRWSNNTMMCYALQAVKHTD